MPSNSALVYVQSVWLTFLLVVALMCGIALYVLDSAKNSNINISAKKRKALAKKAEEELEKNSNNEDEWVYTV